MRVFNFSLPIAACQRWRRGRRPRLSALGLHSQAPGFLDTVGRGAPLRFLYPRMMDVRAAFLTYLICNISGSGGNLPYSPGIGKTWLLMNVHFLISPGSRREQNPLTNQALASGDGPVPSVCRPRGPRASYLFAHCHVSSSLGFLCLRSAPPLPPPPDLTHFSKPQPHSEPPFKSTNFEKSISSSIKTASLPSSLRWGWGGDVLVTWG